MSEPRAYIEEFIPYFTLSEDGWNLHHCNASVAVIGREADVLRFMAEQARPYGCSVKSGTGHMVVSLSDDEASAIADVMRSILARTIAATEDGNGE